MLLKLPSGTRIALPPFYFRKPSAADLTISCKSTFHPDHVTSRLTLKLLDEELQSNPYRSLLDVGCGCGVLALFAAHKGVRFVAGLDIDPRAIHISRMNSLHNNLTHRARWLVGTIEAVRRSFHCVVANLPYAVIDEVLHDLAGVVEPKGDLILSGFHDIEWHSLASRLCGRGFSTVRAFSGDQSFYGPPPSGSFTWMAVLMRKDRPQSQFGSGFSDPSCRTLA